MTPNEYQSAVLRTCSPTDPDERLLMAAMGLAGESGEICDHIKKARWHSHDLDREHLKLEAGDVMWYLSILCTALGLSLDDVQEANIQKLRRRYPDGFDPARSQHRQEELAVACVECGSPFLAPGSQKCRSCADGL